MFQLSNGWAQQCVLLSGPITDSVRVRGKRKGGQPLDFTFKEPVATPDQVDQMEAFLGFTAADLFAAAVGIGIRMQV
ncbi:hypothetical protein N7486_008384 [Penicillium sp. IBT 16267x]|nr:hypothetical protein N7486_008384 [Penicillium sp. IBT 16267x]